eukprot:Blabericola_migrator_1__4001@NODE_2214_length_3112_cov_52_407225_g1394_i0_p2_GENE_NODE_2214_length_3112_cov_52_407225_g1394_i0NODE_2214_length_3112_cov_52_407225_g1394_i0_p2_ORF_typecomplete_len126_score2_66PPDFL/PF15060_6/0_11_NODE_2214_length_3112_cov_52_407225_g1394_i010261403
MYSRLRAQFYCGLDVRLAKIWIYAIMNEVLNFRRSSFRKQDVLWTLQYAKVRILATTAVSSHDSALCVSKDDQHMHQLPLECTRTTHVRWVSEPATSDKQRTAETPMDASLCLFHDDDARSVNHP